MRASSNSLITDAAWDEIAPLLPPSGNKRKDDDRRALEGILYVLSHGIAWYDLPPKLECGSGMTCWRRLRDWHQQGLWDNIQRVLAHHPPADQIDFSRIAGGHGVAPARAAASAPRARRDRRRRVRTSFLGGASATPATTTKWSQQTTRVPHGQSAPAPRKCPVPASPFAQ